MSLNSLFEDEEVALLGLLREVIQADGTYSNDERASVAEIKAALGQERFRRAMQAAEGQFTHRDTLKAYVKGIARVEARRTIYQTLLKVAQSDGLDSQEEKPLRWLASWWQLEES